MLRSNSANVCALSEDEHEARHHGLKLPPLSQVSSPILPQPNPDQVQICAISIAPASAVCDSTCPTKQQGLAEYGPCAYLEEGWRAPCPSFTPAGDRPSADKRILKCQLSPTTAATVVCAAWALVLGRVNNSKDVVFDASVTTQLPVAGTGEEPGQAIATLSVQIELSTVQNVSEYLMKVQQQVETALQSLKTDGKHNMLSKRQEASAFLAHIEVRLNGSHVNHNQSHERSDSGGQQQVQYVLLLRVHSGAVGSWMVDSLPRQLHFVIRQLVEADAKESIYGIQVATPEDVQQLWTWNDTVPASIDRLVHEMIKDQVAAHPTAPAICAWDGNLSYAELDQLAMRLAVRLGQLGVKPGILIPLCFEKSMWTAVAILGVLKAGAAFVLLDTSLPEQRLQTIVQRVKVERGLIVSSLSNRDLSSRLAQETITLDWNFFAGLGDQTVEQTEVEAPCPASSVVYVVFTSGSTGTPKGVAITHLNAASALHHQSSHLGLKRTESRLFDFSSYSFDAAIQNLFSVLVAGACLCVPHDEDRKNRLQHSIVSLRANILDLTPSVARCLCPADLPEVHTIAFSGEALRVGDVERWWSKARIYHLYGPCECTPTSLINHSAMSPDKAIRIGKGVGVVTWVVDPGNHDYLLAPGYIGELLLEGPLVGLGYLAEPEKTAAAFIQDTSWLVQGAAGKPGRRGRLYKTGDLVQYNHDGSLTFVSRKDSQVKINGQRVELGEVEHWVRHLTPAAAQVVAEVIEPQGCSSPMLVAILQIDDVRAAEHKPDPFAIEILPITRDVKDCLAKNLPSYMVPAVFLVMTRLPVTATGKMDRKRLREIGASLSAQDVAEAQTARHGPKRQPTSHFERVLQSIWALVLNMDVTKIGLDDSFLHLGGNSVAAIMVVGEARKVGIKLTVADMFHHPALQDLANQGAAVVDHVEKIMPFSLLGDGFDVGSFLRDVSSDYHIDPASVRDAYPCTPLQQGLMSLALQQSGGYIVQQVLELTTDVAVKDVCVAWEKVVDAMPILRSRLIQHADLGLVQIELDQGIHWLDATADLNGYLESDREQPMGLGEPLSRYALIKGPTRKPKWLVWTIHHAICDGWSVNLIIDALHRAFRGEPIHQGPQFQSFVRHNQDQDEESALSYWRNALSDYECSPFPTLPPSVDWPVADKVVQLEVPQRQQSSNNITTSTLIRAAWALVSGRMANVDDVLFGAVVSGRNSPVAGIEAMVAPTFATVPVRVKLCGKQKVLDYLDAVQLQGIDMTPFEQVGLHRLTKISPQVQQACMFQTLLVVQPHEATITSCRPEAPGSWQDSSQQHLFNSYALMVEVQLREESLLITANFDSRVLELWTVQKLLQRLEHVMKQLVFASKETTLSEINIMTSQDLEQIWNWNSILPVQVERCVHDVVQEVINNQPTAPAICAWDGELSYKELDQRATQLALHLAANHGVKHDMLLPICFEKSMWAPVAMLGVLKAGAGFALLDPSVPEERLQNAVQQLDSSCILSSFSNVPLSSRLSKNVIAVGVGSIFLSSEPVVDEPLAAQLPSTAMFAVFTSGSTGTPKAAVVSHSNFCSGLKHQGHLFGFTNASRVFDFASYAFDVSVHNVFATFASGGCLCIPSEQDRLGNVGKVMVDMQVTAAELTPSVARLLDPSTVPQLKTLILGGEAVSVDDVTPWWGKTHLVNVYGPAECLASTINSDASSLAEATLIGKGAGLVTWVVDSDDSDCLIPPGCIGELFLEGPLICRGYLNDPDRTAKSFINDPKWLLQGAPGLSGRHGRVYKTGDLVRYHQDGSLSYIGRKDAQVKIRGQRFELSEIEHRVQNLMPTIRQVVVEVIRHQEGDSNPFLAAFLEMDTQAPESGKAATLAKVLPIPGDVKYRLAQYLPSYMIPSLLVYVPNLPKTVTGKTDRRRLRELGGSLSMTLTESPDTSDSFVIGSGGYILESEEPAYTVARKVFSMLPPWRQGGGMTAKSAAQTDVIAFHDVILHSCGLDSVNMMSVVHFISRQFHVHVSLRLLMDPATSIRTTARTISELQVTESK